MFDGIYESGGNELMVARLEQLESDLRSLAISTREELQAEVYSRLNAVLNLGGKVAPIKPLPKEGPAAVGDVFDNVQILNQDAAGITRQLLAVESDAARLFNLFAGTQNSLRQQVRELAFVSTQKRFLETFIHGKQLGIGTASLDFGVGMATLPLVSETQVVPLSIELGVSCAGAVDATSGLANLTDDKTETYMVWNGPQLELVVTFDRPRILNRMRIEADEYQGLNVDTLTTSPDGILCEDVLDEVPAESRAIEGSSNKFSGDWVIDFEPKHVKQMRIIISDRVGAERIALRGVSFFARRYDTIGRLVTLPIYSPGLGKVVFRAEQVKADELTSITHQLSYDGVHYQAIRPDQVLDLESSPFWYSAHCERLDSNFDDKAAPLATPGTDPAQTGYYKVSGIRSFDLGNSILERTISLDLFSTTDGRTRVLNLNETPLPSTMAVYQDSALLGPAEYQASGNAITFSGGDERPGVTVRYQTSALGNAGLVVRREYYTPRLYQFSFEKAF